MIGLTEDLIISLQMLKQKFLQLGPQRSERSMQTVNNRFISLTSPKHIQQSIQTVKNKYIGIKTSTNASQTKSQRSLQQLSLNKPPQSTKNQTSIPIKRNISADLRKLYPGKPTTTKPRLSVNRNQDFSDNLKSKIKFPNTTKNQKLNLNSPIKIQFSPKNDHQEIQQVSSARFSANRSLKIRFVPASEKTTFNQINYYTYKVSKDCNNHKYGYYSKFDYMEHFQAFVHGLSLGKRRPPTMQQVKEKSVYLAKKDNKPTLIFDLDETLIHCNQKNPKIICQYKIPIFFNDGSSIYAQINVRPYAIKVLKELSQFYEIIIFTASHANYANAVLDFLDPDKEYISHRLYREHCMQTEDGVFVKDLRIINRNLQRTVLVDNAGYSMTWQPQNGIPILNFYDNDKDKELLELQKYLMCLLDQPDFTVANRNFFQLHKYINQENNLSNYVLKLY